MKHILGYIGAVLPLYAASQVHGWIAIPLVIVSIWFFGYVMFSDWFNGRIPNKSLPDTIVETVAYSDLDDNDDEFDDDEFDDDEFDDEDTKIIIVCSKCSQKLRVPAGKSIIVTCAKCNHKFQLGT